MKTLLLTLLINNPDGSQVEISRSIPMSFQDCDTMQKNVWNMPNNPVAFIDENGIANRYDAACLPVN